MMIMARYLHRNMKIDKNVLKYTHQRQEFQLYRYPQWLAKINLTMQMTL